MYFSDRALQVFITCACATRNYSFARGIKLNWPGLTERVRRKKTKLEGLKPAKSYCTFQTTDSPHTIGV